MTPDEERNYNHLLVNTARVLYKFTLGEEDYTEWVEVANSLRKCAESDKTWPWVRSVVMRRYEDFRKRCWIME